MVPILVDGWQLEQATFDDVDQVMGWFPDKPSVDIWGGPAFRFPFTKETFIEDCLWDRMRSYCLRDPQGSLAAFGQIAERYGRLHMARLVVESGFRSQGVGKRLIRMLLLAGQSIFTHEESGLFVYRHNTAALKCYQSLGFAITEYPDGAPMPDKCYYLIRTVSEQD